MWFAALSGNSGRFAVLLVAGWEAYKLGHHSSLWASLVSFLLLVPTTGGVLALSGHLDLVGLMVVVGVVGIGNSIQGPAWQSLVPALVGPERMLNAGR